MKKCLKKTLLWLLINSCFLLLTSCLVISQSQHPQEGFTEHYPDSAQQYLDLAATAKPPTKQAYQLKAVGRLIQDQHYTEAKQLLTHINATGTLAHEKILLEANLQLAEHQAQQALITLHSIEDVESLTSTQKLAYYQSTSNANRELGDYLLSAEAAMAIEPLLADDYRRPLNQQEIWSDLNQLSTDALATQIRHLGYGQLQGWLEAAYINKAYTSQPDLLKQALQQWQQRYPQHPARDLLPNSTYQYASYTPAQQPTVTTERASHTAAPSPQPSYSPSLKIALLLPNSGPLASSSKAIRSGFMAAYYATNQHNAPNTIQIYDTTQAPIPTLYKQAIANGANVVLGPLTKEDVLALEKMGNLAVPTIALNQAIPKQKPSRYLYEYALSPQDEARQVAQRARRDGHSHAMIIAPAGEWGEGIVNHYVRSWEATGASVVDTLYYTDSTDFNKRIKALLQINESNTRKQQLNRILGETVNATPQKRSDVDVIFMVASASKARQIIPLLKFYYAGDLPIYSTSMVYGGKPDPLQDKDLNGVIFCEMPWLIDNNPRIDQERDKMHALLPQAKPQATRLYAFGMDAYQLAMTLYYTGLSANTRLEGTTGQLYLGEPQQHIYRQLDWAQFKNGVPKKIS